MSLRRRSYVLILSHCFLGLQLTRSELKHRLEEADSPSKKSSPVVPKKPSPDPPKKASRPAKRASPEEEPQPNKRRKKESEPTSGDELSSAPSHLSEEEEEKPKPKKSAPKAKKANGSSETTKKSAKNATTPRKKGDNIVAEDGSDKAAKPTKINGAPVVASDSEMSEVLDEDPKPKKKRKSAEPATSSKSSKKKAPATKDKDSSLDPDEAEIKRLQGWLVKCGIRKIWAIELKSYDTSKAKIRHLKQMLEDAGMTGRYSQEKASEIKERRELQADLEAVKAGAERWGKEDNDDEDDEEESRPKRRLVKVAKAYDFLGDSDGEETD